MRRVECKTQAELEAAVYAGNIAVVRAGFFVARDSSSVVARDSSSVVAWDSSSVVAWDSSSVEARGSSSVEARDSSSVEARDSSSVEACGHVIIRLFRALKIVAKASVTIVRHDPAQKVEGGTVIDRSPPTTAEEWCYFYGVDLQDGVATIFKGVDEGYASQHGADYTPGTVPVALDWDGGKRECGDGLHFSPHPKMTRQFGDHKRYLACPVALADMRAPKPGDAYPMKIKARGCAAPVWEVDVNGKSVKVEGLKP